MSNYSELEAYVATYIKENGNNEITGDILQDVLLEITNKLASYRFVGVITPSLPFLYDDDINIWGIATTNGTYTNYGNLVVEDEFAIISYDGTFIKHTVFTASFITSLVEHNDLSGRDEVDSHPISSITDLQTTLDAKVNGPASSINNSIPVFDGVTGKLLKESSVVVNGDNMKPQLVTFKPPSELTGTNVMDFNLNQNWIVYLSGATTTITMIPITASPVFTCNIEVVQDAIGGRDLVLVDVDGKAIVNTQEFDFTTGGANERCFITIKYWLTGYRYLVDKYV